jgi:hypothetical protein
VVAALQAQLDQPGPVALQIPTVAAAEPEMDQAEIIPMVEVALLHSHHVSISRLLIRLDHSLKPNLVRPN